MKSPRVRFALIISVILFLLTIAIGVNLYRQSSQPKPFKSNAQTAPVNPFGASISHSMPMSERMSVAHDLGVNYFRSTAELITTATSFSIIYAVDPNTINSNGFKVALNVRNYDTDPGANVELETVPKNIDVYKQAIGQAIDQAKPPFIVVGNEEALSQHFTGTPAQYGQMLQAACDVAHSKGIVCISDGMLSGSVNYYVYYYYYFIKGLPTLAENYANEAFESFQTRNPQSIKSAVENNNIKAYIDQYTAVKPDYVNIHWYSGIGADATANAAGFAEAANTFKAVTGRPVITNETGQRDDNPLMTTARMQKAIDLGMPYLIWYSSDSGPSGARALTNPDGTLRATGLAFKDYIANINAQGTITPIPTNQQFKTHTFGFIGCSNTHDIVWGYQNVNSKHLFWPASFGPNDGDPQNIGGYNYSLEGQVVRNWANPTDPHYSNNWSMFQRMVSTYNNGQPPPVIWVQLCENINSASQVDTYHVTTYQEVADMLAKLRTFAPNAQVYLSQLNTWNKNPDGTWLCTLENGIAPDPKDGIAHMTGLINQAIDNGLALAGPGAKGLPYLGPLSSAQIDANDPTHCHPNGNPKHPPLTGPGSPFLGNLLASFIDNLISITPTNTPAPQCTPPACKPGEVYYCGLPNQCVGGCGTTCATPTPTPPQSTNTPVPPTPTGGQGSVSLSLKLSFQGITSKPSFTSTMKNVKVTLSGGGLTTPEPVITDFTSDSSGVFTGVVNFPATVTAGSNFTVLVKGPMHIQKKICDAKPTEDIPGTYTCGSGKITLSSGTNSLDFSGVRLLVGDLPPQNGLIDSYDVSLIRNNLRSQDPTILSEADLNLDGIVDTQDYSLLIASLSIKVDER